VAEVEFQGGMSTVAVQVEGLPGPVLVSVPGVARVARDTVVGLAWDPAATIVLAAE
jgi:hypothetical protein